MKSIVLAALLGIGFGELTTGRGPLITTRPPARMCSRKNSGAAVISEKVYAAEGEFEF
jgi:hypothetical protein